MPGHAIHSNRVVTPRGAGKAFVLIKDGKIEVVTDQIPPDVMVTDIGNSVLMPAITDPHVHINEPGRTGWEGFDTATKSAIAGGITTLIDMPLNSLPVTTTARALEEKLQAAKSQLHCNCGFWGGIVPGNTNEIAPLVQNGVLGFKAFLTHSGIEGFPNVTEQELRKAMPIIASHSLPLLVHCELEHAHPPTPPSSRRYKDYLHSRPAFWEDDAIALMIRLCREFNCHVHIVHLSSANSLGQITDARHEGLPLTVETAPHYLCCCAEEIPDGQTTFKCAPPIREKHNNELLWYALKDGVIDFVATDHSPCPPGMKNLEQGDFMNAWGGIASLQLTLPILWTAGRSRACSITDMAYWLCQKPSVLPGFEKTKGKIEAGFDADLVAWNPDTKFTVTENMLHHRHKISPYTGQELYGAIEQTWLAGEKVFDNGNFVLNKGKILLK